MRIIICFIFFLILSSFKLNDSLIIQSSTSIRDSGFYIHIKNEYKKISDVNLNVVAVGTGQAIMNAKKCDGDILFVHHKPSEMKFVEDGYGVYRRNVMHNDYILVGHKSDPAKIKDLNNIKLSLKKIFNSNAHFVSRGDNSGTHKKEKSLWKSININIKPKTNKWYFETGSGMGSSLSVAINKFAYILIDRATWISFNNKQEHIILVENEPSLINFYGIIPINPEKCKNSNFKESKKFIDWLLSKKGQKAITSYRLKNQQLFFGNAE